MTPTAQKKMRSSTSVGVHVEPGCAARRRARYQPPRKPSKYMSPYHRTCSGPSENAMGSGWEKTNIGRVSYLSLRSAAGLIRLFLQDPAHKRLEVARFGDRRVDRVVRSLPADFEDLHEPV